jgi:hypothetical protein
MNDQRRRVIDIACMFSTMIRLAEKKKATCIDRNKRIFFCENVFLFGIIVVASCIIVVVVGGGGWRRCEVGRGRLRGRECGRGRRERGAILATQLLDVLVADLALDYLAHQLVGIDRQPIKVLDLGDDRLERMADQLVSMQLEQRDRQE